MNARENRIVVEAGEKRQWPTVFPVEVGMRIEFERQVRCHDW